MNKPGSACCADSARATALIAEHEPLLAARLQTELAAQWSGLESAASKGFQDRWMRPDEER